MRWDIVKRIVWLFLLLIFMGSHSYAAGTDLEIHHQSAIDRINNGEELYDDATRPGAFNVKYEGIDSEFNGPKFNVTFVSNEQYSSNSDWVNRFDVTSYVDGMLDENYMYVNNGTSQMDNIEILVDRALQQGEGESEGEDSGDPEDDLELTDEQLRELQLEKAKEVAENIDQYMQEQGIADEIELTYSLNYVKLTLRGETLFSSGQATLKTEAYEVIDGIGSMITDSKFSDYSMQIEGHTDNVPINTAYFPSNWELSAARAIAVGKYIIDEKGIDPTKIVTAGYGEFYPIAENDTAENKAKNRRVEVKVVLQTKEVDLYEYLP